MSRRPELPSESIAGLDTRATRDVSRLLDDVDRNPSSGDACVSFFETVGRLVPEPIPAASHFSAVRELCRIISTERPFPSFLWAMLIEAYIEDPTHLVRGLGRVLYRAHLFSRRLESVVRRNLSVLALRGGSTILVHGYSTPVLHALESIPQSLQARVRIVAPSWERRGFSEGEKVRARLCAKFDVDVRDDAEACEMLRRGTVDTVLLGSKIVGRFNNDLKVLHSRATVDYIGAAREGGTHIVVITDAAKIWPEALCRFDVSDSVNTALPDQLLPISYCSAILTEHGAFRPQHFERQYSPLLECKPLQHPMWLGESWKPSSTSARIGQRTSAEPTDNTDRPVVRPVSRDSEPASAPAGSHRRRNGMPRHITKAVVANAVRHQQSSVGDLLDANEVSTRKYLYELVADGTLDFSDSSRGVWKAVSAHYHGRGVELDTVAYEIATIRHPKRAEVQELIKAVAFGLGLALSLGNPVTGAEFREKVETYFRGQAKKEIGDHLQASA